MAIETIQRVLDDLEMAEGRRIDATTTVSFGLDGQLFKLDLCEDNAAKLRQALMPYIAVAEPYDSFKGADSPATSRVSAVRPRKVDNAKVREWANAQPDESLHVAGIGRISERVIDAYFAFLEESEAETDPKAGNPRQGEDEELPIQFRPPKPGDNWAFMRRFSGDGIKLNQVSLHQLDCKTLPEGWQDWNDPNEDPRPMGRYRAKISRYDAEQVGHALAHMRLGTVAIKLDCTKCGGEPERFETPEGGTN